MNIDEQRLSQLLKGTVPHPPHALSADQVTIRPVDRPGKSWALPAMAAAAVVAIGVTAGALAANHAGGGPSSPASPGSGPAPTAGKPPGTASGSTSPHATPTAGKAAVPNATGMSSAEGLQVMAAAGFTVTVMVAQAPADQAVAPGTVYGQTPAAGTVAPPGTKVTLYVESRPAA